MAVYFIQKVKTALLRHRDSFPESNFSWHSKLPDDNNQYCSDLQVAATPLKTPDFWCY